MILKNINEIEIWYRLLILEKFINFKTGKLSPKLIVIHFGVEIMDDFSLFFKCQYFLNYLS